MEKKLTPELLEKAKQAKSAEELIALAKENGVELTAEEANTYFAKLNPKNGELSDDELDQVAGGGCHAGDGRMVVSLGYVCHEFKCKKDGGRATNWICIVPNCGNCGATANCGQCRYCTYEKGLWLCNNPENMK